MTAGGHDFFGGKTDSFSRQDISASHDKQKYLGFIQIGRKK